MRILILSTYPAANPIHGGQHRLSQIAHSLLADGHEVDVRGILGAPAYKPRSGYLRFPGQEALCRYIPNSMLMEDWAIGRYAADPNGGFRGLSALCDRHYDIVHCEQPWLFEFAHKRFAEGKRRPLFVYGSQNIEHQLKHEIVEQYLTKTLADRYSTMVEEVERFAAANADLVVAVSDHDKTWLQVATAAPVVVARNGVIDRRASIDDIQRSNSITESRKFAIYCASGHPPNVQGFYDIVGRGIGCFAPEERLVIAGGAGPSIIGDRRFAKASGLARKIIVPGEVTEAQLRGLLATAHLIILPITRGGGTNLKTAEALWSGRHIVATTVAMRGFESFAKARGLTVADHPSDFLSAVQIAMGKPSFQLRSDERADRASVLWQSTMKPLQHAIQGLKESE
jgi:glycosyltransferase involved in cell wall biosynthesis